MKPRLQTSLGQQLVLTPQLRQALHMLQLSIPELEAEINDAVESNPLLEWDESSPASPGDERASDGGDEASPGDPGQRDDPWDDDRDPAWGEGRVRGGGEDPDGDASERVAQSETLRDHLAWQLNLSHLTPREVAIGETIVDAIDEDGYLREPLSAIVEALAPEVDRLECALTPPGFRAVGPWYADFTQVTDDEVAAWMDRDQDLMPLSLETIQTEMSSLLQRHPHLPDAARYIRLVRRREVLRISLADACELVEQHQVSTALAAADQAAVEALLDVVHSHVEQKWGQEIPPAQVAVIAMGRQGGYEAGYGSDLDVMFVHEPTQGIAADEATRFAVEVAKALMSFMKMPTRPPIVLEPVLEIDAALRPEGRRGPLVRSLDSYKAYYKQWADTWEVQALLKARPIAGPRYLRQAFLEWADSVRYTHGLNTAQTQSIRRMKARVEAERLPRGADPARHLKLGRGGLTDVEWLIQTLQLQYAPDYPALRTTNTLEALQAAKEAELLDSADADILIQVWSFATRIRSGILISTAKSSDVLPTNRDQLEALARWAGYDAGEVGEFEDDYLRLTRHARAVFERVFYGVVEKRTF